MPYLPNPYAPIPVAPAPAPAPPRDNRRNLAIFGGIGAAVIVLVVVLVVALSSGSKGGNGGTKSPGSGSGQAAWSKASLGGDVVGTWADANDVIVATTNALTAYQAANGKQNWSQQVPAGDTICSMSQGTSSPLGAYVYGSGQNCGRLQIVNLSTGETLWSSPLSLTDSNGQGTDGSATVPSIQGSYLVAPFGQSDIVDIDLSTGDTVWNSGQSAAMQDDETGCVINNAVVLGTDVYTSEADCAEGGTSQVWKYSAASATPPTVMNLPSACVYPSLLQVGSDLLMDCNEGKSNAALYLATPGSSSFSALKVTGADSVGIAGDADGTPTSQSTLSGLAVHGSTLYIPDWANRMISIDAITAIDLDSGRTLWTEPFGSSDIEPTLLGATGAGALVGYSTNEGTYALTTLAASSGAPSAGRPFDAAALGGTNTTILVGAHIIGVADKPGSQGDQLVAVNVG